MDYGNLSPLLWQKELTTTLQSLGFLTVPHEPCIMIKDGILVFFYVDDIVFAYRKEDTAAAQLWVHSCNRNTN